MRTLYKCAYNLSRLQRISSSVHRDSYTKSTNKKMYMKNLMLLRTWFAFTPALEELRVVSVTMQFVVANLSLVKNFLKKKNDSRCASYRFQLPLSGGIAFSQRPISLRKFFVMFIFTPFPCL